MSYNYHEPKATPREYPRPNMVRNAAGGTVFQTSDDQQLRRFLIIGTTDNTFYARAQELTKLNLERVRALIAKDPLRALRIVVEISREGRAPKKEPALAVMAMLASDYRQAVRTAALRHLYDVVNIPTDLFTFVEYANSMRGWGRGLREAVGEFYKKPVEDLAFHAIKYKQRGGWSHRDLLRLAHPNPPTEEHGDLYRYIVEGFHGKSRYGEDLYLKYTTRRELPFWYKRISAMEGLAVADQNKDWISNRHLALLCVSMINNFGLTREMLPTRVLKQPEIWEALFPKMGYWALLRNLGNMSACGFLTSSTASAVAQKLSDPEFVKKSMIHPIKILDAWWTYKSGQGFKGDNHWTVIQNILEALENAFYFSFGNLQPTGKKRLIAVDSSGSMSNAYWSSIENSRMLPVEAAACLAMAAIRPGDEVVTIAFDGYVHPVDIHPYDRLETVIKKFSLGGGSTNVGLPFQHVTRNRLDVDSVEVYTDNVTWYGQTHYLKEMERMRPGIRTVWQAMTPNQWTCADPTNPNVMEVVGFDAAAPELVNRFISTGL